MDINQVDTRVELIYRVEHTPRAGRRRPYLERTLEKSPQDIRIGKVSTQVMG